MAVKAWYWREVTYLCLLFAFVSTLSNIVLSPWQNCSLEARVDSSDTQHHQ